MIHQLKAQMQKIGVNGCSLRATSSGRESHEGLLTPDRQEATECKRKLDWIRAKGRQGDKCLGVLAAPHYLNKQQKKKKTDLNRVSDDRVK